MATAIKAIMPRLLSASTATQPAPTIKLGFGLYGMKQLAPAEAIRACKKIGYDGVELCLIPGWPTEPKRLAPHDRRRLRRLLTDTGLIVPSLLESLRLIVDKRTHQINLDRLKAAAELGHYLSSTHPPIVQTILGGKPDQWEQVKHKMADCLLSWAQVAKETKTVVAIKPHVSHALHTPDGALWLLEQIKTRWIKVVYDYSHYALLGLDMAETISKLIPKAAFVQAKDSKGDARHPQFLLPGDGRVDYVKYLKLIYAAGYRGFIAVEVSSQIHSKPDYDPIAAAGRCYRHLEDAFEKAGIRRI
jgi:inosose dehydratase